ncbi:hypothetical protein [Streptomyces albidoflavus]|uniref:hypothetical protein n=1 Tax=Streptomyces albidoflavus TaxID=1886 RepID=UPI003F4D25B9
MSTDPAAAPADEDAPAPQAAAPEDAPPPEHGPEETRGEAGDGETPTPSGEEGEAAAPALSEAEAELAAQRELRRRIEERKAGREAPVEAGGKLQGAAADLLAAVKAVEGGAAPTAYLPETAPAAPLRGGPARRPSW